MSTRAQILLATLAQPARQIKRIKATVKVKSYHLSQASGSVGVWRLARSPMLQTVLNNARLRHWGLLVPSDFATTQSPDEENRMSGGVGEVAGPIPLPPHPISIITCIQIIMIRFRIT
jgi:hypothetical protein